MELIAGSPGAEFGDKSSLIAQVATRSGLSANQLFGNVDASYGSFGMALYNFLSTFSGTHFLGPRTIAARIGFAF